MEQVGKGTLGNLPIYWTFYLVTSITVFIDEMMYVINNACTDYYY